MPKIIIDVPEKECEMCPCNTFQYEDDHPVGWCGALDKKVPDEVRIPACKEAEKEYGKLKDLAKIGKDATEKAADLQKSRNKVKAYCEKMKEDQPDGKA